MTRADEAKAPSGVMGPMPPEVQGRKLRPIGPSLYRYAKHGYLAGRREPNGDLSWDVFSSISDANEWMEQRPSD